MPKPKILRTWREMAQTYLVDGPPRRDDYEAILWVNRCELRETPKGRYILRSVGIEPITADTKEELEKEIARFMLQEDVRLLARGLESNDFDMLPNRDENPAEDVIEGTADIYHFEEEPANPGANP
jgi:hypothetical protein